MTFADKLQKLIQEQGWTVLEFTRRCGKNHMTVRRWLRLEASKKGGDPSESTSEPGFQDALKIADMFRVDVRWLIDPAMGWEERIRSDSMVAAKIRRLDDETQLTMLLWQVEHFPGSSGEPKQGHPDPREEKTPTPDQKPENRRRKLS